MRRFFRSLVVFSALIAASTSAALSFAADVRTIPSLESQPESNVYGTYVILKETVIEDVPIAPENVPALPNVKIRFDSYGMHVPNGDSMRVIFDPNGQVGLVDVILADGQVQRGLYAVQGDVLVIHMAYTNQPRPADFNDVPQGVKFSQFYFRRVSNV